MIKDEEIDLTEHRDFRGDTLSPLFIRRDGHLYISDEKDFFRRMLHNKLYGDFPWEVNMKRGLHKFDGLVALGNKEQRRETIEIAYWGSTKNVSCDCCGEEYIKIPWNYDFGLCKQCKEDNEKNKLSTKLWWME